jgi:protein-disulfide isomerase
MTEKRLLFFSSIFLLFICVVVAITHKPASTFSLNVENQHTYGKIDAPVHMILFEEFSCSLCQALHKEALPFIESNYVETGKLKITIIPLAFLENSIPACTLSLCVQKLAPPHIKSFQDFLFNLKQEDLISFSYRDFVSAYIESNKNLPAPQILKCLREESFEKAIEHNLSLAKKIYPGDLRVPIVLINGKLIKNADKKNIMKAIDEKL